MCICSRSKLILESVSQFFGVFQFPKKEKPRVLKIKNKKNWGKNCENVEGWKQSGVENLELMIKFDILPGCQTAVDPRILEVVVSVHVMGTHEPFGFELTGRLF